MLDKTKVYIVDFEDSFTFNIASEIYQFEKKIKVINHVDFFTEKYFDDFISNVKENVAIILGPGPGSPEEYRNYFHQMKLLKSHKNIFLMGICLGHQVIALMDGLTIKKSFKPLHGNQVKINFDDKNILVQRYNSLAVFESNQSVKEIQIRQWMRGVSYQFHPESIGSENRSLFFKDLIEFVK